MSGMVRYEAARHAIAEARNIDEAKDIADKALALQAYARQAKDPEMEAWVAEIRLRAKRRIGELSAGLETNEHRLHDRGSSNGTPTKISTLTAAGISKTEAHRCEQIAAIPAEVFETYITEKKQSGKAVTGDEVERLVKKVERKSATVTRINDVNHAKTTSLDALINRGMKFGTIYADPPWLYGNQGTRGATSDHYTGMTVDEIAALPILDLVEDNAHLHLWTTNAFLFESKRIMEAWGFEYKSCFVWVKPQMGMGNYWRVSHEFMLFGIRGKCPFMRKNAMSWMELARGKHSAKPEEIRKLIESVSPSINRLELFGRKTSPGWVVWGNEIDVGAFNSQVEELVA